MICCYINKTWLDSAHSLYPSDSERQPVTYCQMKKKRKDWKSCYSPSCQAIQTVWPWMTRTVTLSLPLTGGRCGDCYYLQDSLVASFVYLLVFLCICLFDSVWGRREGSFSIYKCAQTQPYVSNVSGCWYTTITVWHRRCSRVVYLRATTCRLSRQVLLPIALLEVHW